MRQTSQLNVLTTIRSLNLINPQSLFIITFSTLFIICTPPQSYASSKRIPITNEKAILSIIGEAEGEPQAGRIALGCAIRNRGHLSGVYGLNAPRVKNKKYSKEVYNMAVAAWNESQKASACRDVNGADHWENIKAFGKPKWAASMVVTTTIGSHTFMKSKTKKGSTK